MSTSASCLPLVSCVMVTRDRRDFVMQSIEYFERQDYVSRELVIIDDGTEDLAPVIPLKPCIRYVKIPPGLSIGCKRNLSCEVARGEIIAQWDDDDWYAPERLSAQVAPILAGTADITALTMGVAFELERWRFWRCTPRVHRCMFIFDVHGGTLAFSKRLFNDGHRYPDKSLMEDALFLSSVKWAGGRLAKIPGDDLFVYIRHLQNAWQFNCGEHIDPKGWNRVEPSALLARDWAFYESKSGGCAGEANLAIVAQP